MFSLGDQMEGYALPLPAINSSYNAVERSTFARKLPAKLKASDLNFLQPRGAFTYPHALFSMDAATGQPGIVENRDRARTNLFMDSGGYAFINGARLIADIADLRPEALNLQERYADAGVVVDVPTACIDSEKAGRPSFDTCLKLTQDSIDYAVANRTAPSLKLLNIVQGRDKGEARRWYEAVRGPQLNGWGFAGAQRKNISLVLELLVTMLQRGDIPVGARFHVFGTNHPGVAVLLTQLQRRLRAIVGDKVEITFDSSTSFRYTQAHGIIVTGLNADRAAIKLETYRIAERGFTIDGRLPWPFAGPLTERLTVGDYLSQTAAIGNDRMRRTDTLGQLLLSHQSLYGELAAIVRANRLFDMEHADDWQNSDRLALPWPLHKAVEHIEQAFEAVEAGDFSRAVGIARRSKQLATWSGSKSEDDGDLR